MRRLILAAAVLLLFSLEATRAEAGPAGCPLAGYSRVSLQALKAADWAVADDAARNRLALAMVACLGSPDPVLRDGLAFEALNHWLRARLLSKETMLTLADVLQAKLTAPEGQGFERPFAALTLSIVARADRVEPFFTPARRAALLDASVAYLTGVRDYRGFDDKEGWRHGVAHGADLMLQLTLNPAFGKPELTRIREAVASQIAPAGHAYVFGESERLAVPILYMAQRGVFTEADWTNWLGGLAAPAPLKDWDAAFASEAGLARVHDVKAFFQALYINAKLDRSADDDVLLAGTEAGLKALP